MKRLMPTGLPGPSSMNSTLGSFTSRGLPSGRSWNLVTPEEPTTCSGGMPYTFSVHGAHELDAAARDDEGLEAVRAQVGEQLEHGLVDQLGVGPVEPRMSRGGEPVEDAAVELLHRHARVRCRHHLEQALLAHRGDGLDVALEQRLEGLPGLPFGVLRRQRLHAVDRERELEVDRLLGPQRAVVVEGGDALGMRHEVRAALVVTRATKSMIDRFTGPSFQDGSGSG